MDTKHLCPVCGFPDLTELPRRPDAGASFEICPSCGFQFGVDDDDRGLTYAQWRAAWIKGGLPWSSTTPPPSHWNAAAQLAHLERSDRPI
jgi:hypothetical protein